MSELFNYGCLSEVDVDRGVNDLVVAIGGLLCQLIQKTREDVGTDSPSSSSEEESRVGSKDISGQGGSCSRRMYTSVLC